MAEQLTFDLPPHVRLGAADFFVSDANEQAFALMMDPAAWPDGKLALIGPSGSGKTHLARLFAERAGAQWVDGAAAPENGAALPKGPLVIDNGDQLPDTAQEWVFHAHNHLRASGQPLLITAQDAPARWSLTLPDLASRMQAMTVARIAQPDDALLLAVLMKHFQDRQLAPTPDAVTYLARHLPRSFAAVRATVDSLDRAALTQGKALTRPFVRTMLDINHS